MLSRARILVIGIGGLGSSALFYLAASGIGAIGIADHDTVGISNLQRQILYATQDIGLKKVRVAEKRVQALNPGITIHPHAVSLDETNIDAIILAYDVILDGTDNFKSKFLINDACVFNGKPFVHAGVEGYGGQVMTVVPGASACYRCIFKAPPPCDPEGFQAHGVLGPVPGIIGAIQATEAIKIVTGKGDLLTNRLFVFDALHMVSRTIPVKRQERCRVCHDVTAE